MNRIILPSIKKVMLPNNSFLGKNILVTGGGSGLGQSIATAYSNLGGNVTIVSRDLEKLESTAEEIKKISGNKVNVHSLDVSNHEQIEELCKKLSKDKNFPNIVVNNAAGNFLCPSEKLSYNAWNRVLDIVLKGTIDMTLSFGKEMISRKEPGSFINISTTYAKTGSAFVLPSSIAKAGCDNLVKSLSTEWGKYGIRLNAVAPGPIYTEGAFSRLDPTGDFEKMVKKSLPTGRLGEKEELANIITYLGSDYANWMTGQIINFDGGEVVGNSGEFNKLLALTDDQWKMLMKK